MSKSIKRAPAFQIPTIEEVEKFMNQAKPEWPVIFCARMAKKFVMSYQAKGWVYGGKLMKDWHAAFWANWAELKYKEDIAALEEALRSWTHKCLQDERRRKSAGLFAVVEGPGVSPHDRFLDSLDEILAAYKIGNANDIQLRNVAEWLERNSFQGVTPQQADRIAAVSGNNGTERRIETARQFFANLQKKGWTVKQYYFSKQPQPGEQRTA